MAGSPGQPVAQVECWCVRFAPVNQRALTRPDSVITLGGLSGNWEELQAIIEQIGGTAVDLPIWNAQGFEVGDVRAVEVCVPDGEKSWRGDTLDIASVFGDTSTPGTWRPGDCDEPEKSVDCVESQEWTYGIDNTGTRYQWADATYLITLSDGSTLTFQQTTAANGGWTPQMAEWGAGIQAAADAAGLAWFVETRYRFQNDPSNLSGGGGFAGPPSVAVSEALENMVARYVNIQICPGQPVPVRAQLIAVDDANGTAVPALPRDLTADGAVLGPIQKFWMCTSCGNEPVWYLADGVTLADEGQIPDCWEPCGTLALTSAPPDRDCTFEIDVACDNNNSDQTADFTNTITRRATICNGEQIAVDFFQQDPDDPNALIDYALVGDFVDCATGEPVPEPDTVCNDLNDYRVECVEGGGDSQSDPVTHTTQDNNTDFTWSYNSTGLKLQGQDPFNSPDAAPFFDAIVACIEGGGKAKITFTNPDGVVGEFVADTVVNDGYTTGFFTGVGDTTLLQSGKVRTATTVCCNDGEAAEYFKALAVKLCGFDEINSKLCEIANNTAPARQVQVLALCDDVEGDGSNLVPIFVQYTLEQGQPVLTEIFSDVALTQVYNIGDRTPVDCDTGEPVEPPEPLPLESNHLIEGCVEVEDDGETEIVKAFTIVNQAGVPLFAPRTLASLGFVDCCPAVEVPE